MTFTYSGEAAVPSVLTNSGTARSQTYTFPDSLNVAPYNTAQSEGSS